MLIRIAFALDITLSKAQLFDVCGPLFHSGVKFSDASLSGHPHAPTSKYDKWSSLNLTLLNKGVSDL